MPCITFRLAGAVRIKVNTFDLTPSMLCTDNHIRTVMETQSLLFYDGICICFPAKPLSKDNSGATTNRKLNNT